MYTTKDGRRRFQVSAPVPEETYESLRHIAVEQRTTLAAQIRKAAAAEYVGRQKPASSKIDAPNRGRRTLSR
jgi:hypothetical protein